MKNDAFSNQPVVGKCVLVASPAASTVFVCGKHGTSLGFVTP
jgi:hypothetical protein